MEIIKVTTNEHQQMANSIRHSVFVLEQGVSAKLEFDGKDESSELYLLYSNEQTTATCRVRETSDGLKIERFAVLKEFRNKNFGAKLLERIVLDCKKTKKRVYLNAQESVVNFYAKYGFVVCSEKFYEADIPHFQMELA